MITVPISYDLPKILSRVIGVNLWNASGLFGHDNPPGSGDNRQLYARCKHPRVLRPQLLLKSVFLTHNFSTPVWIQVD